MSKIIGILQKLNLFPHQGVKILGYNSNGGIFRIGEKAEFGFRFPVRSIKLFQAAWAPENHFLREIDNADIVISGNRVSVSTDTLANGMYILETEKKVCAKFYINSHQASSIGVVVPIFTEWGYHHDGFYWNEHSRAINYFTIFLRKMQTAKGLINKLEQLLPEYFRYPYRYPFHTSIAMDGYYAQNHRWRYAAKSYFDSYLNDLDGLWSEEYKFGIPLAALLQKLKVNVHFFSDINVHDNDSVLFSMDKLIFYSSELMTRPMYDFFCKAQSIGKPKILFWGMQAIGLREVDYDKKSCLLRFKGHKGQIGLSGEKIACSQVSWSDEEEKVFGVKFPLPENNNWRTMHTKLNIDLPNDELMKGVNLREIAFHNPNVAPFDNPGLTNCGGEFFDRADKNTQIIGHLDNLVNRIGIGRYGIFTHVAPTYLPAFGVYFYDLRPEVDIIFNNWINT